MNQAGGDSVEGTEKPKHGFLKNALLLAIICIAFAACISVLFLFLRQKKPASIQVKNNSGVAIKLLTLTINGEKISFSTIPAGAKLTQPLKGNFDNEVDVTVRGELADGTLIKGAAAATAAIATRENVGLGSVEVRILADGRTETVIRFDGNSGLLRRFLRLF